MDSAIVSVVIKSHVGRGKIPRMGQTVRVAGHTGLFTVLTVDKERRTADLMAKAGIHSIEKDVPFQKIQAVDESVSQAIREFLNS